MLSSLKTLTGLAVALTLAAGAAEANSTINVTLWDKGPDSGIPDDTHPMGLGTPSAAMAMAMVGVKADKTTVPAGKVTFDVKNSSKDLVHEMVLLPAPTDPKALPYDPSVLTIDEDKAGHLGEVSELDPGKTGSLTIDLKPGTYLLVCNIPAHYMDGMWTEITVK